MEKLASPLLRWTVTFEKSDDYDIFIFKKLKTRLEWQYLLFAYFA